MDRLKCLEIEHQQLTKFSDRQAWLLRNKRPLMRSNDSPSMQQTHWAMYGPIREVREANLREMVHKDWEETNQRARRDWLKEHPSKA